MELTTRLNLNNKAENLDSIVLLLDIVGKKIVYRFESCPQKARLQLNGYR